MNKILMRAGATPFERFDDFDVLKNNPIGNNSGNLLFAHAVYKHLSRDNVNIDINNYKANPLDADQINEKYDAFVIPLANAFRPSFIKQLTPLTALVRKLKIPCVVVGVGAQADLVHGVTRIKDIDTDVKAFVSAVLDKSASIGVRGDFTNEYLRGLGFSSVETIGCPSFYLNGDKLKIIKKPQPPAEISYNLTPKMPHKLGKFFERLVNSYPNHAYVAQDKADLELFLLNKIINLPVTDQLPSTPTHASILNGNAMLFSDVPSWINQMRQYDFTIGTRIHGNMFSLHAGTPAFLIAHDSRTLELARYLKIPHRVSSDVDERTTVDELYNEADYTEMNNTQAERFTRYRSFLKSNGLSDIWDSHGAEEEFDKRISLVRQSLPIRPTSSLEGDELYKRIASALNYLHLDTERLRERLVKVERDNKKYSALNFLQMEERLKKLEDLADSRSSVSILGSFLKRGR